jgi:hypothetical protein
MKKLGIPVIMILSMIVYPRLAHSQFIAPFYNNGRTLPVATHFNSSSAGNVVVDDDKEEQEGNHTGTSAPDIRIPIVNFEHMAFQDYIDRIGQLKNDFRMAVIAGIYNELLTAEGEQKEKLIEALNHLTSLNPEEREQAKSILQEFDFYNNLVEEYEAQIREIAHNAQCI